MKIHILLGIVAGALIVQTLRLEIRDRPLATDDTHGPPNIIDTSRYTCGRSVMLDDSVVLMAWPPNADGACHEADGSNGVYIRRWLK